jgi:hypothetical protein
MPCIDFQEDFPLTFKWLELPADKGGKFFRIDRKSLDKMLLGPLKYCFLWYVIAS